MWKQVKWDRKTKEWMRQRRNMTGVTERTQSLKLKWAGNIIRRLDCRGIDPVAQWVTCKRPRLLDSKDREIKNFHKIWRNESKYSHRLIILYSIIISFRILIFVIHFVLWFWKWLHVMDNPTISPANNDNYYWIWNLCSSLQLTRWKTPISRFSDPVIITDHM